MTRLSIFCLSLSLLTSTTWAEQTLTIQHFAYQSQLMGGKSSLRQVDLPPDILMKMKRHDWGDLRVFNADGQLVPHQFIKGETQKRIQNQSLAFYPFDKEQAADLASIRIRIEQKGTQQSVDVQSHGVNQKTKTNDEFQYIIENSISQQSPSKQLCQLNLDWQQSKPSMILPLKIESSNHLEHWVSLSQNKSVSKLNYAGSQLLRSKVEIPCTTQHYLRLRWLKSEKGIKLTRITGRYHQAGSKKMQWDSLGKPEVNAKGDWLFENKSVVPITQLSLKTPSSGLLYGC